MKFLIIIPILCMYSFSFAEKISNTDDAEFKKILFCQSNLSENQKIQLLKKMSTRHSVVKDVNNHKVTIYHLKNPITFNQISSTNVILKGESALASGDISLAYKESYKQVNKNLPIKLNNSEETASYYKNVKDQMIVLERTDGFEVPIANATLSCIPN